MRHLLAGSWWREEDSHGAFGEVAAVAGAAVRPFGPEVVAAGACGLGLGEAATAPDGSFRGFAECGGSTDAPIRFFSRTAAGAENPSENSGFRGKVLGVTVDTTASYVLFRTVTTISIGKRTNAGAYSSRAVDTWTGVGSPAGDVIAQGGRWFGVWSKQVGPGGEFADVELFQGGSVEPFRRITNRPDVDDLEPTLAYSGTIPVLVWSRLQAPAMPGPSDLWVAKYLNGAWQSRVFASLGTHNSSPDIATAGGLTFVTWSRDGHIVVAGTARGPSSATRSSPRAWRRRSRRRRRRGRWITSSPPGPIATTAGCSSPRQRRATRPPAGRASS